MNKKIIQSLKSYPRNMVGYGKDPIHPKWPNKARIAVQFVLNYEEGAENSILHGDNASEAFLSEIVGAKAYEGARHMSMESIYEYGSRVGVWRILNLFKEFDVPVTIFAVALAIARNRELADYLVEQNYDICAHGFRWIDYQFVDEKTEREHIKDCISVLTEYLGKRPEGWYTGRNSPNTRRLIVEEGGFLYDSDTYDDDLPYWSNEFGAEKKHLIIPYTLDVNDMRFASPQGFNSGDQFFNYLKDTFDALYLEGEVSPKMMSVGMHARILGRPGRIMAMRRFLEYVKTFDNVWLCSRREIADHWYKNF
ncbi:allantoinase PuuE [Candidatus Thioglobus sp.]|nr:allantoinase PuuE [Candidatus Thioglobus sp.]MDB9865849.1 allantoinase PuuE [Candidatus Thioglobus sp.]MDB9865859.1 allantoinase PuuE [Candidatus Thioglobus sp.]